SYAATGLGLPAIAPAIRSEFGLTLTQTGVVLAASFFGSLPTLLVWGLVADRIGERFVMAGGLVAAAGALVWAAYASSFGMLVVGSTSFVTTQLSLLGFFVLFLHDQHGVSTAVAAGALAVTQVLGGISRIGLGRWSDRLRMRIAPLRWVGLGIAVSVGVLAVL